MLTLQERINAVIAELVEPIYGDGQMIQNLRITANGITRLLQDCQAEIARLQQQLDAAICEQSRLRGEQQEDRRTIARLTQQLAEQFNLRVDCNTRWDKKCDELEAKVEAQAALLAQAKCFCQPGEKVAQWGHTQRCMDQLTEIVKDALSSRTPASEPCGCLPDWLAHGVHQHGCKRAPEAKLERRMACGVCLHVYDANSYSQICPHAPEAGKENG